MSAPTVLFACYFSIGFLLLIVALASDKKKRAAKALDPLVDESEIGAGLLIFIVLLWPIWLIASLSSKDDT